MRVLLDASSLLPPRTGIGNVTANLVKSLLRLDKVHEYTLFLNSLRRPLPNSLKRLFRENVRLRRWRVPGPWLHKAWKNWNVPPLEWLAGKADILHAPASILPPLHSAAQVLTLHDCYFMRRPEHCHEMGGLYMRETLPKRIQQCSAIICVSEFTRQETLELLPVEPARLQVIYSGVDRDRFFPLSREETRERMAGWNWPSQFFLTVATLEPRKNLETLLEAVHLLKQRGKDFPPLVCAGGKGFQHKQLFEKLHDLNLEKEVFFPGFMEPADLLAAYNACQALIMPSRYEGFGLPLLEALACGAPLLASDIPPFHEAAGNNALYFDPESPESLADALERANYGWGERQAIKQNNLTRARQFSWNQTARKTLAVYENLV